MSAFNCFNAWIAINAFHLYYSRYGSMEQPVKPLIGQYKIQPGRIENYTPGKSSVSDKEAKQVNDSHIYHISNFRLQSIQSQKQKWNSSSLSNFFSFYLSTFHNILIVLLVSRVMLFIYILEYKLIGDEYPDLF